MKSAVLLSALSLAAAENICTESQLDGIVTAFTADATWGPNNSTFSELMDSKSSYWTGTCINTETGDFNCEPMSGATLSSVSAEMIAACQAKYDNYENVERPATIAKANAIFATCTPPANWDMQDKADEAKTAALSDFGALLALNCKNLSGGSGGGGGDGGGGGGFPSGGTTAAPGEPCTIGDLMGAMAGALALQTDAKFATSTAACPISMETMGKISENCGNADCQYIFEMQIGVAVGMVEYYKNLKCIDAKTGMPPTMKEEGPDGTAMKLAIQGMCPKWFAGSTPVVTPAGENCTPGELLAPLIPMMQAMTDIKVQEAIEKCPFDPDSPDADFAKLPCNNVDCKFLMTSQVENMEKLISDFSNIKCLDPKTGKVPIANMNGVDAAASVKTMKDNVNKVCPTWFPVVVDDSNKSGADTIQSSMLTVAVVAASVVAAFL